MDILKAIYSGEYNTEHTASQEYQTARRRNAELVEQLLPSVDEEFIDQLNASFADMADVENFENFLAGLRLGMAVMREYYQ